MLGFGVDATSLVDVITDLEVVVVVVVFVVVVVVIVVVVVVVVLGGAVIGTLPPCLLPWPESWSSQGGRPGVRILSTNILDGKYQEEAKINKLTKSKSS